MKTVKVTYRVQSEFCQENQKNVNRFINDLSKINDPGIRYFSFLGEDGETFTHLAIFTDDRAQRVLLELESFLEFQKRRDASGLKESPKIEEMEMVASSVQIFAKTE